MRTKKIWPQIIAGSISLIMFIAVFFLQLFYMSDIYSYLKSVTVYPDIMILVSMVFFFILFILPFVFLFAQYTLCLISKYNINLIKYEYTPDKVSTELLRPKYIAAKYYKIEIKAIKKFLKKTKYEIY